jgi:signal transduction histidine kinase
VIQALKDGMQPQINARKHTLVEQIPDDLPDLKTDYYRLLQVLTNLMSNAVKYTPEQGTVTLALRPLEKRVEFSIADTGVGLSKESLRMLGTKFWRAEDDFTRSQPGTGLGFAITRSLVEQMGSHIEIQSELGKGSTFTFSISAYS